MSEQASIVERTVEGRLDEILELLREPRLFPLNDYRRGDGPLIPGVRQSWLLTGLTRESGLSFTMDIDTVNDTTIGLTFRDPYGAPSRRILIQL